MSEVTQFAKMLAEKQLQTQLWKLIKKEWWHPFPEGQLYIDEKEEVLVIEYEPKKIAALGFLHFYHDSHSNPQFGTSMVKEMIQFRSELQQVCSNLGYDRAKIIVVTPYKLSNYSYMPYQNFPMDVSYFYMTESPKLGDKKWKLQIDETIEKVKTGEDFIEYAQKRVAEFKKFPRNFKCNICDGDEETGCQFFDPSECPMFT